MDEARLVFDRLEIAMEVKVMKEQLTHQAILLLLGLKKVLNIWVDYSY